MCSAEFLSTLECIVSIYSLVLCKCSLPVWMGPLVLYHNTCCCTFNSVWEAEQLSGYRHVGTTLDFSHSVHTLGPSGPSPTLGFITHNFDLHSKGEREGLRYHYRLEPCSAFHIRLYNYCLCLEIDICNCLHTYYLVLIRIDVFGDLHLKIMQRFWLWVGFLL